MMKNATRYLLTTLALFSAQTFAADFKITDQRILGEYKLVTANDKSKIKTASIVYSLDNELTLYVDRNDGEYQVVEPKTGNFIVDFQDEPNCDGDEESCWFDSNFQVTLTKNEKGLPRITINVTASDAWIEDGSSDESNTYVLDWANSLPDQIPFYTYLKDPVAIQMLDKSCKKAVDLANENDTYISSSTVCPSSMSYNLRKPYDDAIDFYVKNRGRDNKVMKEVTAEQLTAKVFNKTEAYIRRSKSKDNPVPVNDMIAQNKRYQDYILNKGDRFFLDNRDDRVSLSVYNSKTKVMTSFDFRFKE